MCLACVFVCSFFIWFLLVVVNHALCVFVWCFLSAMCCVCCFVGFVLILVSNMFGVCLVCWGLLYVVCLCCLCCDDSG